MNLNRSIAGTYGRRCALLMVLATGVYMAGLSHAAPSEAAPKRAAAAVAEMSDPFMGDWQGTFTSRKRRETALVAQVIALGKGRYHANLLPEFDGRVEIIATLEGQREGDTVRFSGWGDVSAYRGPDWNGLIKEGVFTGDVPGREGGTFALRKVVRLSPRCFSGTSTLFWNNGT